MVDGSLDFLPKYSEYALDAYRAVKEDGSREDENEWQWNKISNEDCVPFSGGDTQGFIAADKDTESVFVSFRGTETDKFGDIWTDLSLLPKSYACKVKVHSGAAKSLAEVEGQIREVLELFPSYEVNITGHSLGGMLGQALAINLAKSGHRLGKLVTFGSPPAGNQALSSSLCSIYKGDFIRVVNCSDIVPRSKVMALKGYRHANGLIYIDRHGQAWKGLAMTKFRRFIDRSILRLKEKRIISLDKDHHSMALYHELMKDIYS